MKHADDCGLCECGRASACTMPRLHHRHAWCAAAHAADVWMSFTACLPWTCLPVRLTSLHVCSCSFMVAFMALNQCHARRAAALACIASLLLMGAKPTNAIDITGEGALHRAVRYGTGNHCLCGSCLVCVCAHLSECMCVSGRGGWSLIEESAFRWWGDI